MILVMASAYARPDEDSELLIPEKNDIPSVHRSDLNCAALEVNGTTDQVIRRYRHWDIKIN
jgi:hypothetical protein